MIILSSIFPGQTVILSGWMCDDRYGMLDTRLGRLAKMIRFLGLWNCIVGAGFIKHDMTIIKSMRFKFRKTFFYPKKPALYAHLRFWAGFYCLLEIYNAKYIMAVKCVSCVLTKPAPTKIIS